MPEGHYNVLFLSSRNTSRSIFAEAVANRLGQGHFKGFSAGMNPAQDVHPLVLDILRKAQYSTEGLRPKHWQEFTKAHAPVVDFVFTLCDPVAGEPLPHWSGRPITADWRYPDPANLAGKKWERRELGRTLAGLERQFRAFIQLPFKSLDEITFQARLAALAEQGGRESRPARSAESPTAPPLL
jgi:arsenate reductase (thioredoxin)